MDFFARGAYHRAKKIMRGPRNFGKEGTVLRVGFDGVYRKRKKVHKTATFSANKESCINYALFCKEFGSCDGQTCEF